MGSFITSSIGTMRVTEQIDALEVMGVNSLNYLVFPKIIAIVVSVLRNRNVSRCFWLMAGVYGGFTSSEES
jgi:phospholipid/cholesterol/gamma-HCH transport system permease protein